MCQQCANQDIQAQVEAQVKPRIRLNQINLEASVLTAVGVLVKQVQDQGIELDVEDAVKAVSGAIIQLKETDPAAFEGKSGSVLAAKIVKIAMEEVMQNQAQAPEQTVLFLGNDTVAIKPFETLDDALVTSNKVAQLVYPETLGEDAQYAKYEADLVRVAATIPVLPEERKFEGLVGLLAVVLMGFEPQDLPAVKDVLRESLEAVAVGEVRKNTETFLRERGFGDVAA